MRKLLSTFLFFNSLILFSQHIKKDSASQGSQIQISDAQKVKEMYKANNTNGFSRFNPSKAGWYSAILPGLGQYYNKKYWKIPLVWGAIGTGVGVTIWNNKQYHRYRNAFLAEINGVSHEFSNIPSATKEALGRTQEARKRDRDYAIAITGLIYVLGIMDAIVDAHLAEQRKDPDLVIQPTLIESQLDFQTPKTGIALSFRF